MVELNLILSVLLYIFGIILLIVLTILGIRLIRVVDKMEKILDNVEAKVNSFNSFFLIADRFGESLSNIMETVVYSVSNSISKIFGKKSKKRKDEEILWVRKV